jgi:hypothetical protein
VEREREKERGKQRVREKEKESGELIKFPHRKGLSIKVNGLKNSSERGRKKTTAEKK